MDIEIRASGLKAMREKRGLTQRQLARDLGISQNYVPALEANSRQPGPKLWDALTKYFGCDFWDMFEVVLIDPDKSKVQRLGPRDDSTRR